MKKVLVAAAFAGICGEGLYLLREARYRAAPRAPMSEKVSAWCGGACRNPGFCLN
jgi:hypothetical protein